MTMEKFVSVRSNNLISLGLGLIVVIFIVAAVAASAWSARDGFIGMAILGALY
ncbi:MAG: hypothetical protein KC519_05495 [Anaerolineae bacterium]|nr:hypothetical protein [Anaerolineae bacterium]